MKDIVASHPRGAGKTTAALKVAKLTKKERDDLHASLRASKRKFKRQYPADLTGYRFGKLVVLRKIITLSKTNTLWECVTDCGWITQATSDDLTSGRAQECDFRPSPPKPLR